MFQSKEQSRWEVEKTGNGAGEEHRDKYSDLILDALLFQSLLSPSLALSVSVSVSLSLPITLTLFDSISPVEAVFLSPTKLHLSHI